MQSRKDFLAAGALAALVPQVASAQPSPAPKAEQKSTSAPDFPKLPFDLAAFDASLTNGAEHRHLFAMKKIDGGSGLEAMRSTLNAYADIGIALTDVLPVAVLYHGLAIFLAFNDAVWNDILIPAHSRMPKRAEDDMGSPKENHGNPFLHPDKPADRDDSSLEKLIADSGARFFVCNNATRGIAGMLGKELSLKPTEVYERLTKSLVPNAMLVPAGVWAIHAIQERKFTLLQATV